MHSLEEITESLTEDRDTLAENLAAMGISDLTDNETFTSLAPRVLEIQPQGSTNHDVYIYNATGEADYNFRANANNENISRDIIARVDDGDTEFLIVIAIKTSSSARTKLTGIYKFDSRTTSGNNNEYNFTNEGVARIYSVETNQYLGCNVAYFSDKIFTIKYDGSNITYGFNSSLSNVVKYLATDATYNRPFIPTNDGQPASKLYVDKSHYELMAGYDSTKTQVLKNINGTLTWVDE